MTRRIVFDTETGGFEAGKHALLTLAMVCWEDDGHVGRILPARLDLRIWDGRQVEESALRVNGINLDAHRAGAMTPQRAIQTIETFLGLNGFPSGGPWVELGGHHAGFDVPFLQSLWSMGDGMVRPFSKRFSFMPRCSWALALWLRDAGVLPPQGSRELPDLKLGSLCRYFGIPLEDAHSALADTMAAAHLGGVLHHLLRQVKTGAAVP